MINENNINIGSMHTIYFYFFFFSKIKKIYKNEKKVKNGRS